MSVRVIESVGLVGILRVALRQESVYCRRITLLGKLLRSIILWFGFSVPEVCRLEVGHVQSATGLRQQAYEIAERGVAELACAKWASRVGILFEGVNVGLLVEKLLFEERYDSALFQLLCLRLASERPEVLVHGVVDARVLSDSLMLGKQKLDNARLRVRPAYGTLRYFAGLAALPLLLLFHWVRYVGPGSMGGDEMGGVVCSVDAESTFEMMRELFGEMSTVRYVCEPQYEIGFADDRLVELNIGRLHLSQVTFRQYLKRVVGYMLVCLSEWRVLRGFGLLPFRLYHLMLKAEGLTPSSSGICFVTSGHLTLERAARNELLRARGSTSVNVSKNCYVTYRQFPAEWRMNYDAFGAAGQHAIDLYKMKRALSSLLLTGSYDMHRPVGGGLEAVRSRRSSLERFVEGRQLVVVLSPGACDETRSHERRLMALAATLSLRPDTRVLVRRKPGKAAAGYETFYDDAFRDAPDVWVTADEFDLFDTLGMGAIFITSISSSACDIALRGGQVLFIDFMGTPELYLPWVVVPGIVSSEAEAYERINSYLSESLNGPTRQAISTANREFVRYLGKQYQNFSEYRTNLLATLGPWLPIAAHGVAVENVF